MTVTEQQGAEKRPVWKRGLLMLLFAVAFGIGQALLNLSAIVQFLWLLFVGEPNRFLVGFGRSLAIWLADAARFLSCASEDMPFPWKSRPEDEPIDDPTSEPVGPAGR